MPVIVYVPVTSYVPAFPDDDVLDLFADNDEATNTIPEVVVDVDVLEDPVEELELEVELVLVVVLVLTLDVTVDSTSVVASSSAV